MCGYYLCKIENEIEEGEYFLLVDDKWIISSKMHNILFVEKRIIHLPIKELHAFLQPESFHKNLLIDPIGY
jgi:hypothetical protein